MKRYFEVVGKKQVMELSLKPPAAFAKPEELGEALHLQLREIDRNEYNKLAKKYTS